MKKYIEEAMKRNNIYSTDLFCYPSFVKGVARLGSIYGHLDEYNYKDNADEEALEKDWIIIGKDIGNSIEKYGEKIQKDKQHTRPIR